MLEQISLHCIQNRHLAHNINYASSTYWRRIDGDIKRLQKWFLDICVDGGDTFGPLHGDMRRALKALPGTIVCGLM